ncbi:hypothetical protein LOAG_03593 [Loa loa]|uniref:Uncharacterized protein n=1 Tax=Loa loa TaxID=7209 RepID=A0A1S0U5V0_LOALO|nr:hypothetical protein LOAG_03593 [Loa loa]EFO24889.1 hypothetical protein LOAG_03593 [Loa loa]
MSKEIVGIILLQFYPEGILCFVEREDVNSKLSSWGFCRCTSNTLVGWEQALLTHSLPLMCKVLLIVHFSLINNCGPSRAAFIMKGCQELAAFKTASGKSKKCLEVSV